MDNPKVSVVIPIYNVEKYLDRCISSVVNQTYENIEIILVDDGSPDNCPAICNDWAKKDNRIKVIHKQNAGLGMARNTGIDHATGDYIFFFDSDDYVDERIVEKCVDSAVKTNADTVVYGRKDLFEDGTVIEKRINSKKSFYCGNEIKNIILPGMFTYDFGFGVSAWGKMFSLDIIRNNELRFKSEKEIISEDAYFTLEYFSNVSGLFLISEGLYYYFKRNNSLSRSFKKDRQQMNNIFLLKSIELINKQKLPNTVLTHLTVRYHLFTLSALKQIYSSDLPLKQKKSEIYKILKDNVLRSTLKNDVIVLEDTFVRLFFSLLKNRLNSFCYFLICIRSLRKN